MKTAVAQTSLDAFHSLPVAGYLQPKEAQVMAVFGCAENTFTRQQLSRITRMPLEGVCGRVRSLLDKKALAVRGYIYNRRTRKTRELLGLPVAAQGGLF
jgi:ribulose kinase